MKSHILAVLMCALLAIVVQARPEEDAASLGIIDKISEALGSLELGDGVLEEVIGLVEDALLPNGELLGVAELPGAVTDLTEQLTSLDLDKDVVQQIVKTIVDVLTSVLGVAVSLPELPSIGGI